MNEIYEIILSDITQPIWENWYIKENIGEGAFSKVYKIEAERFGRKDVSALKIEPIVVVDEVFFNEEQKKNILDGKRLNVKNESDIMYALRDCPYIVRYQEEIDKELYIDGSFEGYYFLLKMELLTPVSKLIIDKKMDFSEQNIIKLAKNIGQGIKAAHDKGIIHRDIKPANLFVSGEGVYKLGDFNVSKKNVTARTITGSGRYMAPEIFRINSDDSYTRQADIYSFGICLYQFMNNMYFPFEEKGKIYTDVAIDKRMRGERFPKPENSSEEFGRIILKACEFDTSERYKTIEEMLFDLENIDSFGTAENNVESEENIETNNTDNYATEYTGDYIENNVTEYAGNEISVNEDTDATQYAGEYYTAEDNVVSVCEEAESECYTYDESEDISEIESDDENYSDAFETDLYETNDSDFEIEDGILIKYHGNAEYVKIPDSVTGIGKEAFKLCKNLISVIISSSCRFINDYAFDYCGKLVSIIIMSGCISIFGDSIIGCGNLTSIQVAENNLNYFSIDGVLFERFEKNTIHLVKYPAGKSDDNYVIPNYVKVIGSSAFACCKNLTSVKIPYGVESIYSCAFICCEGLTSVTIPDSVIDIGYNIFDGCNNLTSIKISDKIKDIKYFNFFGCENLTLIQVSEYSLNYVSVDGVLFSKDMSKLIKYPAGRTDNSYIIPNGVKKIVDTAFYECTSLASITIPEGVTKIGDKAFYGCTSLTSITIPEGVTKIGDKAFYGCTSLTSITIPESVTKIDAFEFSDYKNLISIQVAENNLNYVSVNGVLFSKDMSRLIKYPVGRTDNEYIVPNSVKYISYKAFKDCKSLVSVTMPNCIIGTEAFYGCDSLSSVVFSKSLRKIKNSEFIREIGWYAFSHCKSLNSIVIPKGITNIDSYAFEYCQNLTSIIIPKSVRYIGDDVFKNCENLISVNVPAHVDISKEKFPAQCKIKKKTYW